MTNKQTKTDEIQGEGDYKSARRYDERTRDFVEAGKVEAAARAARPASAAEQDEMIQAEKQGRARSKGEDRLLAKGSATERPRG